MITTAEITVLQSHIYHSAPQQPFSAREFIVAPPACVVNTHFLMCDVAWRQQQLGQLMVKQNTSVFVLCDRFCEIILSRISKIWNWLKPSSEEASISKCAANTLSQQIALSKPSSVNAPHLRLTEMDFCLSLPSKMRWLSGCVITSQMTVSFILWQLKPASGLITDHLFGCLEASAGKSLHPDFIART